jgi:mono/diheme cytochrome c family protein
MRSIFPDKMPAWLKPTIVLLFVLSWIPLAMIAMDRATPSNEPRMSIIPDMDKQEKFTAQAGNPLFKDGRAMRPLVAGTVQYGRAHQDPWLYRGIKGGSWAAEFPIKPNAAMMARGQRQYNIYCSVCHGMSGYGNGMVAVRADALLEGTWTPPANLHDKLVVSRAPGHIFNTITNGIRNMPPYGTQITPEDRWAIVLYVKALQRSQSASITDVTNPGEQTRLLDRRQGEMQREEQEAQRARETEEAARREAAEAAAKAQAAAAEAEDPAADAPATETETTPHAEGTE